MTKLTASVLAALVLLTASACSTTKVTAQRAADVYATSVEQVAGERELVPPLTVVGHRIDETPKDLGVVVLITFGDRTLFEASPRINAALAILAAAADRSQKELSEGGIGFVELQAGGEGTRGIVPVSRLLLLAHSGLSADELRTTVSLVGTCCPHKGSPSPGSA